MSSKAYPSSRPTTRIEASVASVSWIPAGGVPKLPLEVGSVLSDPAPPLIWDGLERLHGAGAFPGTNLLRGWIEVKQGQVVGCGRDGRAATGVIRLRLGFRHVVIPAVSFPLLRPRPIVGERSVRFSQTAGARIAVPSPRRGRRGPFFHLTSAPIWTTVALTIYVDGRVEQELVDASLFPCHALYDGAGRLVTTSDLADFKSWYRRSFGGDTPWGLYDSPALVRQAEAALERELAGRMEDDRSLTRFRTLAPGTTLVEEGETGDELFLLLEGTLIAEVDGRPLAELGPGSIVGERALLDGQRRDPTPRTATLRARTRCRVAAAAAHALRDAHRSFDQGSALNGAPPINLGIGCQTRAG